MKIPEVHYRYWLAILTAALLIFVTRDWYAIKDVSQLVSFGVGLASLVVSLVAIGQAIASGFNSERASNQVRESLDDVRAAAKDVKSASDKIEGYLKNLPDTLGTFKSKLDDFQVFQTPQPDNSKDVGDGSVDHLSDVQRADVLSNISPAGLVTLYACFAAQRHQKELQPSVITSKVKSEKVRYQIRRYMQGFLVALQLSDKLKMTKAGADSFSIQEIFLDWKQVETRLEQVFNTGQTSLLKQTIDEVIGSPVD